MTLSSRLQAIPAHRQGSGSDSDHPDRTRVGSVVMAALRAKRERPSEFRELEMEIKCRKDQMKTNAIEFMF